MGQRAMASLVGVTVLLVEDDEDTREVLKLGLELYGAYVSAAVRCAPPDNKPSTEEFDRCRRFLIRELPLLPNLKAVVCLGRLALDSYLAVRGHSGLTVSRPRMRFGHGVEWFEEPISPEDIDGYRELKSLTSIYLAAGENEFTKHGFREWIARRAVDILQPDLCSAGGFTECRKISALAQAWHIPIVPYVWGSGIGLAASLQFLATLPPAPLALKPIEPMLEYDQSSHPFRQDLIFGAIGLRDGMVPIPDAPGIGVEINRAVIERYSIR